MLGEEQWPEGCVSVQTAEDTWFPQLGEFPKAHWRLPRACILRTPVLSLP